METDGFEVGIGPGDGQRYPARAESSTAGETGTVFLTIDLAPLRADVEALVDRRMDIRALREFGARLYDLIIPAGPIRDLFSQSLGRARAGGRSLRILLAVEPSELAVLPWEYLYDPQRRRWFATSTETLLVRYPKIPVDLQHFCVRPPLRMLFVAPESSGLASKRERDTLVSALRDMRGVVELHTLDREVTVQRIREMLNETQYHVVHFVGHAGFRGNGEPHGFVRVDGASGGDHALAGDAFAALFNNQARLKLVFLNACEGATVSSAQPLVGIAPELLLRGVPSVIGLQFRVFDDVAVVFAREFYASLFRGSHRGVVDVAITEARNHLATEYGSDISTVRALGEPVLFLHANEGMLFLVESPSWTSAFSPAAQQLNRHAEQIVRHAHSVRMDAESKEHVLRYVRRRRLLRRTVLVALTLLLAAFAARGVGRVLGIDQAVQNALITHLFAAPSAESAADVVVITPDAGTWDVKSRATHAKMVKRLIDAGVKLIVFDIEFYAEGDSPADAALAEAIALARERGISTVAVADSLAIAAGAPDGDARLHGAQTSRRIVDDRRPHVASALRNRISGTGVSWLPSEGGKVPRPCLALLWAYDEHADAHTVGGVPGLAFAAYCRSVGIDLNDPTDIKHSIGPPDATLKRLRIGQQHVRFTHLSRHEGHDAESRLRYGDTLVLCPYRILEHQRVAYEDVLKGNATAIAALRDKYVFIGQDHLADDQLMLSDGSRRAGVRFHADVFAALRCGGVGRMPTGVEFVLLLAMAFVGACVGGASRWSAARRAAAIAALLIAYGLLAAFVMADTRLVFDPSYPAAALVIVFLANYWIEQRWYSQARA